MQLQPPRGRKRDRPMERERESEVAGGLEEESDRSGGETGQREARGLNKPLKVSQVSKKKNEMVPPLSSSFVPFSSFSSVFLLFLSSLFHLSPGVQPRVIPLSFLHYSHSSFNKRHTHTQMHTVHCSLLFLSRRDTQIQPDTQIHTFASPLVISL